MIIEYNQLILSAYFFRVQQIVNYPRIIRGKSQNYFGGEIIQMKIFATTRDSMCWRPLLSPRVEFHSNSWCGAIRQIVQNSEKNLEQGDNSGQIAITWWVEELFSPHHKQLCCRAIRSDLLVNFSIYFAPLFKLFKKEQTVLPPTSSLSLLFLQFDATSKISSISNNSHFMASLILRTLYEKQGLKYTSIFQFKFDKSGTIKDIGSYDYLYLLYQIALKI